MATRTKIQLNDILNGASKLRHYADLYKSELTKLITINNSLVDNLLDAAIQGKDSYVVYETPINNTVNFMESPYMLKELGSVNTYEEDALAQMSGLFKAVYELCSFDDTNGTLTGLNADTLADNNVVTSNLEPYIIVNSGNSVEIVIKWDDGSM